MRSKSREFTAQLELKLVRNIKGSKVKRDSHRYNMGPQVDGRDNTVKVEVITSLFHISWHT